MRVPKGSRRRLATSTLKKSCGRMQRDTEVPRSKAVSVVHSVVHLASLLASQGRIGLSAH